MLINTVVPGWRCIDGDWVAPELLEGKYHPARADDSDQADQPVQHDRGQRCRGRDSTRAQNENQGGLHHTDPAGH
jgi:hypothetical protein